RRTSLLSPPGQGVMREIIDPLAGTEHLGRQGGREAVPVEQVRGRSRHAKGIIPVRPRLHHGGAADLRFPYAWTPNSSAMECSSLSAATTPGQRPLHKEPRTIMRPIAYGAEDCFTAAAYIRKLRGPRPLLVYGISSGARRPVCPDPPGDGIEA